MGQIVQRCLHGDVSRAGSVVLIRLHTHPRQETRSVADENGAGKESVTSLVLAVMMLELRK